ncbi:putative pentatricopeptide repeat-containing protein At3g49142 [Oryza brachyantha]|uniref:DYW domain-containing protein n=1 Tax=Oryza brachyantha TaxID=4533 RepID=J3LLV2_ORYBR|nr:putative pentatricopeptide repeat-containing protein At3g49142 [Oryza brachyantha]
MDPPRSLFPELPPAGHALLRLVDSCRSPAHLCALRAAHARLLFLLRLPSHPASAAVRVKLMQAYAACAALPAARAVLDSSPDRSTVFFNVLLRGLTAASLHRDALLLFASMRPQGPACFPDHYTYPLALKSCAATNGLILGLQMHSSTARLGLDGNAFVAHSMISMYARCGRPDDAYQMFEEMLYRDVVSWNAMISGFAHAGLFGRAMDVFRKLVAVQCPKPDAGTMASILPAMEKARMEDITLLRGIFDKMQFKGLISWNAMIAIYTNNEMHVEAVELFMRMQKDDIEPDAVTLATVLPSCGEVSALSLGKRIHEIIKRKRVCSSMLLENALMDMYASCGCLKEARSVFDSMGARDVVSWTSIISAYGRHGHGREAIDLFEKMRGQGLEPDSIAFVAVLAACSHAGLLDMGKHYFYSMTSRYHISPKLEHYACMVDLLGRAGCISEAYDFIVTMPIKPNERVWGALLGACRIHSNMDIGLLAADNLLILAPKQTGYYVLLSNIYARAGRWADVSTVRSVMESKGIKKLPGVSNAELGDQVYTFHIGDTSHPQSKMIYEKLTDLLQRIREMGYNPEVEATLHDVEEEDREGHLSVHSEKLAIAFVLLNTSPGTPIRVSMNLRTCSDCHRAAKLISTITSREIILKDVNRIHYIAQGLCSCGDYW